MKRVSGWLLLLCALLLLVAPLPGIFAQDEVWAAWEAKDVATLGDDNTGSSFAVSSAVQAPSGAAALEITPSGTSEETKMAVPLSGVDLQAWAMYGQVLLEVYLPEGNTVNANRFFLGMADVGGEWTWVDGIFGEGEVQPGWNTVTYTLTAAMQQAVADHSYMLYFAFFNADDSGNKTPLTEPLYLGGATLSGPMAPPPAEAGAETTAWAAWEAKDVATLGDDNTGSSFAVSSAVQAPSGAAVLEITPSGTSEETKMAVPLSGADLQAWAMYGQVLLEVYLPEGNTVNANRFFLGMADVGGEWTWVDGIFGEAEVQPGWNTVTYTLTAAMQQAVADHSYMLYFAFFNADDSGNKTPLTEPLYLGGATLSGPMAPPPAEAVPETVVWAAWEARNPGALGDDNTGTDFAASTEILTPNGANALEIIPAGTIEETKFSFPVSGANVQDFVTYGQLELEIYLPPENAINPTDFFLGMADITGEWSWVGGTWGVLQGDSGWTSIIFSLDPAMRQPNPNGAYMIYLASMAADENGNKTPLTESFYLGSGYFAMAEAAPTETPTAAVDLAESLIWQPWTDKAMDALGNDNTGATFAFSADVTAPDGGQTLAVMPGGESDETKVAFSVSGADLADWANYTQVELDVYLPEGNALNANRFFLGMGDNTGEWSWVGGIFGGATDLTTGWNRVVYVPLDVMREVNPEGSYILYMAFFNEDGDGKHPLTEPFYLGGITLTGPQAPASAGGFDQNAVYDSEVQILLGMDDDALLDAIAHETFDFFWREANPENGLIKDRSTPDSPSSIASVGFGLSAITVAVDRGWITYDQGYERALTTLRTFANGGVQGDHGFFYHFVDMQTGQRVWSSEISSIDTTLFIAGALTAGQYFQGTEVETLANQLYEQMDWEWMMAGGSMVSMGWKPDIGFLSATWNHFDESVLLYILAIASPTHPAPVDMWAAMDRPVDFAGEFIYLGGDPLFVYQYPLAYLDLRGKEDAFANYFNNTTRACQRNRKFAADNAAVFATYQNGVWGISASDGPRGYQAYGASGGRHDGTVAPYASISCLPFTPEASFESIRAMLADYGSRAWREYGFVSAINAQDDWFSREHIGIDEGDTLLMIVNYQDNFIWNLFMQNPNIQQALQAVGFADSQGDYAVTPAYLEAAGG